MSSATSIESEIDNIMCPVCMDIEGDPLQTTCGHTICRACDTKLRSIGDSRCPHCTAERGTDLQVSYPIKSAWSLFRKRRARAKKSVGKTPVAQSDPAFNIVVKNGVHSYPVNVTGSMTVLGLKKELQNIDGTRTEAFYLVYGGRPLKDSERLRDRKVQPGHCLLMMTKSLGGRGATTSAQLACN